MPKELPVEREVSNAALVKFLKKWQEILRLQDWDVEVDWKSTRSLPDGAEGACHIAQESRGAYIAVMDPISYVKTMHTKIEDYDPEMIIAHELLHIHLNPIYKHVPREVKEVVEVQLEQAIEAISRALIKLDRRGNGSRNRR